MDPTHVKVHLAHTRHAALPTLERLELWIGEVIWKLAKSSSPVPGALWHDSGVKWRAASLAPMFSFYYCHPLVQGSLPAVIGKEAIRWEKPEATRTGLHLSFRSHTMVPLALPFLGLWNSALPSMAWELGAGYCFEELRVIGKYFYPVSSCLSLQVSLAESCVYLHQLLIQAITIPRDPGQGQRQRSDLPLVANSRRSKRKRTFISYSKPFSTIEVLPTLI